MGPALRTWFLRDVLESVERERSGARQRITDRAPDRLKPLLEHEALKASQPTDTMPLDEGEELLLLIDSAIGDAPGRVLEHAGFDLSSRQLFQRKGSVIIGDLRATVIRMQIFIERPFVGVTPTFKLDPHDAGFCLTVGISGRSRAARTLGPVVVGCVRAAQRFSRETSEDELQLSLQILGDRAVLDARYLKPKLVPEHTPRRPPSRSMRAVTASLSDEVDRILTRGSLAPGSVRLSSPPPSGPPTSAGASSSGLPSVRGPQRSSSSQSLPAVRPPTPSQPPPADDEPDDV